VAVGVADGVGVGVAVGNSPAWALCPGENPGSAAVTKRPNPATARTINLAGILAFLLLLGVD
jgi:hypothetical protein